MSRHITDHGHRAGSVQRVARFAQNERRQYAHPATKALAASPRPSGAGRIKAYTRIERQAKG